jgi:UDP-N-acetylmuramoyl-tripeptide--D-alanyl-D-alanine ligase
MFKLDFIKEATGGSLVSSPEKTFTGYSTDNRDPNIKGTIFIPLVGEQHDAHKFVEKALENGAAGALVHHWDESWDKFKDSKSFIKVKDTLKALQHFAKAWRKDLKGQVLALTGSNGKTTTKDFLGQILSNFGATTVSQGSFNNHWGVPFTLLNTKKDDQFCVLEMGMNHAGELIQLVGIGDPDFVGVINVGNAHIGHFENGIEGVARAKEEIYEAANPRAQRIFNVDNPWTREMYKKYSEYPCYTYSLENFSADVYFRIKEKRPKGFLIEGQIGGVLGQSEVSFFGEHNISNLAAAVTFAYMAGCRPEKLWPLLPQCHTGWGRNQWVELKNGAELLFDGYNANPDSFKQLLENSKEAIENSSNPVAIFGEMLELGNKTEEEHYILGKETAKLPLKHCVFIGPSAPAFKKGWDSERNDNSLKISSTYKESLDIDLETVVDKDSLVIVKGSRGGALERVVERLDPVQFSPK